VLGRWVGTAPGAKVKEAHPATHIRGSHASNCLWGARIASREDTLDVICPAQVDGSVASPRRPSPRFRLGSLGGPVGEM
jgi:hypothetical protein